MTDKIWPVDELDEEVPDVHELFGDQVGPAALLLGLRRQPVPVAQVAKNGHATGQLYGS